MKYFLTTFIFSWFHSNTWEYAPEPVRVYIKLVENSELAVNNLRGLAYDSAGQVTFHAARMKNMVLWAREPGTGERVPQGFVIWKYLSPNVRELMISPWSSYRAAPDAPGNWDFYLLDDHEIYAADNKGGEISISGSANIILIEGTMRVRVGADVTTYTLAPGDLPVRIKV